MIPAEPINWRAQLIQSLLIFFGGGFWMLLWCTSCFDDMERFAINYVYSGSFWVGIWKGSEYFVYLNDRIYSWMEAPVKRLFLSLLSVFVCSAVVVYGLDFFFDTVVFGKSFEEAIQRTESTDLVQVTLISLGINTFMHGRGFLLGWRQTSIDMEKLKTEQISTQYQSLRNQVNPHFLFNSLNALTSLVYDDQAKAVEFIRKLSQVYRYVLDKKDEELVPLTDEISFMENFIYLQKIRFGDNLLFTISKESDEGFLPPLALQILVENAIKHNVVSEKDPLNIQIEIANNYCVVSNNIKEKLDKDSTGIGLSNLQARYQYLTKREVEIVNDGEKFVVKLPILELGE